MMKMTAMAAVLALVGLAGCVPHPQAEPPANGENLAAGRLLERCVEGAAGEELSYTLAADGDLAWDVHYHDAMHRVVQLASGRGASAAATVTAPEDNTYCLAVRNDSGRSRTVAAAMGRAVAGPGAEKAGAGQDHGGPGHHHGGPAAIDHGGMAAMAAMDHGAMDHGGGAGPDYIRVPGAGGRQVVIGRPNPLSELRPRLETAADGTPVKVFDLTVEEVHFELYPGKTLMGWGFNGLIPGPTIRVRQGDRLRIRLTNKTDTEHTIHVHGQKKPVSEDGVPYLDQEPVPPGGTHVYEFTATEPGTNWYHCHVDTAHHVDMGMYGAFIVTPAAGEVAHDREYLLILDEWPTAHVHHHPGGGGGAHPGGHTMVSEHPGQPLEHHLPPAPATRDWYPTTYKEYQPVYDGWSINGRAFPYTEPLDVRSGDRVLLRLINAGYQPHYIHTHGHRFQVVARDGSPVDEPAMIDTVTVGPAQRVDILLVADNPGVWPVHCHALTHVMNDHVYPGGMLTFLRYLE